MKFLIAGNWKMNPTSGIEAKKIFSGIRSAAEKLKNVETIICPPLVYLESLGAEVSDRACVLGAQDCFWERSGAYTGEISPEMIFNAKARYVIIGHSERRALGDSDEIVNRKLKTVLQFPLIPIVCVGEKKRDDDHNYLRDLKSQVKKTFANVSSEEMKRVVVAYEPVWAIGAQALRACAPSECAESAQFIRTVIADLCKDANLAREMQILYGGSADENNAESFLREGGVQGLLVGRASLDPKRFAKILKVAEKNIK